MSEPSRRSPADTSPEADRVPWREKLAFGVGGLPMQFGEAGLKSLAVPVYQLTLMVDPALLGLMMALPRFIDAFTDPLMGHLSDRTRSRFGRRRPYVFAGAWLSALAFIMVWFVPLNWSQTGQLGWFVVTSTLFFLCNTIWGVPYQSLGFEITADYHERTRVMGATAVFIKAASFMYQWLFPLAQLALFASVMQGVRTVALAVGFLIFGLAGCIPAIFVQERFAGQSGKSKRHPTSPAQSRPSPLRANILSVWHNRDMRILAGLTLLQILAGMLSGNLDLYLIVYYIFKGDLVQGSIWKGLLSSIYAIVGFLAIWPAVRFSRRFDKRSTLRIIYILAAAGGLMKLVFFNPAHPWLMLFDPILCGPVYVGLTVLVPSMVADLCDADELQSGQRREGLYGAVLSWLRKTGMSLAFLGSGLMLNLVGFDAALKGAQSEGTLLGIRLLVALTTCFTSLIALFALHHYRLNESRAREIRAELESRRGAI